MKLRSYAPLTIITEVLIMSFQYEILTTEGIDWQVEVFTEIYTAAEMTSENET